jgi:hypothetical protein
MNGVVASDHDINGIDSIDLESLRDVLGSGKMFEPP